MLRGTARTLAVGVLVTAALTAGGAFALRGGGDPGPPVPEAPPGGLAERPLPDERAALPERTLDGFADGPPIALAGYRGGPLVVNFWAAWCAPCVEEMPDLATVAAELEGEVAVLGVDVQDAPRNAEPFVAELGIPYDLAVDPTAELFGAVRAYGMPTTLLVDPEGTVVYRHTGPLDAPDLRALVADHLGAGVPRLAPGEPRR